MRRLIDADAFYEELHSAGGCGAEPDTWADGWDKAIDEAIKLLDRAPTIEAEPVRSGRKAKSAISGTGLMCTACYSDISADAVFCKYCGAKMDGGGGHATD